MRVDRIALQLIARIPQAFHLFAFQLILSEGRDRNTARKQAGSDLQADDHPGMSAADDT